MENWGLITGRTSIYLLDPKNPDLQSKKVTASVQSHEVAHMWYASSFGPSVLEILPFLRFGNITTMEWWNYLYLNEGLSGPIESNIRLIFVIGFATLVCCQPCCFKMFSKIAL